MKNFARMVPLGLAVFLACTQLVSHQPAYAAPQNSVFTFQSELRQNNLPVNGLPDFEFRLFDALQNGVQRGSTVLKPDYPVSDGLLTVDLDFGSSVFTGDALWLEITMDGTVLSPRQRITSTPYAANALRVNDNSITSASIAPGSVSQSDVNASEIQVRVNQTCANGSSIRTINSDGSVDCETDDAGTGGISGVTTSNGLTGGGNSGVVNVAIANGGVTTTMLATQAVDASRVNPAQVQLRVSGSCGEGQGVQTIDANGAVGCEGFGDIKGVLSGEGLAGGGDAGTVTLAVAPGGISSSHIANGTVSEDDIDRTQVQDRVNGACLSGSAIRTIAFDGKVECEDDDVGLGDITNVIASSGLAGGGSEGEVALALSNNGVQSVHLADDSVASIDIKNGTIQASDIGNDSVNSSHIANATVGVSEIKPNEVQVRINGNCVAGAAISQINQDGSVECLSNTQVMPVQKTVFVDLPFSVGDVSFVFGVDGNPVVAMYTPTTDDLIVLHCKDRLCNSSQYHVVDSTPGAIVGEYNSIAINDQGKPVIAYYDRTNGDLKVATCSSFDCNGLPNISVVESTNDVGQFARILIGAGDSNPMVAHYDATLKSPKVTFCANSNCSLKSTFVIEDTADDLGRFLSMKVITGAGEFPSIGIAYQNSTTGALHFARCGLNDCTAPSLTIIENSVGFNGQSISVLDVADGRPVVAYSQVSGATHKVMLAKCSSAGCGTSTKIEAIDMTPSGFGFPEVDAIESASGLPLFLSTRFVSATPNFEEMVSLRCTSMLCNGVSRLSPKNGSTFLGSGLRFSNFEREVRMGVDGNPVIVGVASNNDLVVHTCSDPYCMPFRR